MWVRKFLKSRGFYLTNQKSTYSTLMIYVQKVLGGKSGMSSSFYFSAVSLAGVFCNALLGTALAKFDYSVGFLILAAIATSGIIVLLVARKFSQAFALVD